MYSFEGQYRRFPQQNLAGASVQQKKDELLHKVHEERMKREVSQINRLIRFVLLPVLSYQITYL